jgi:myo-inositol-1(or 4)-monophosphatase
VPDAHAAERAFAGRAIGEAAEIARGYFGRVAGTIKPDEPTQVLTEADLAVGRHLVAAVRAAYPDHNVVDEEAGVVDRGSAWTWVIDPIDGTSNFAAGVPLYGIFVGLLHEDLPVVGAVALPSSHDVYTAARGAGADKNGAPLPTVDDATPLARRLLCYGIDGDHRAPATTRAEGRLVADLALACLNHRTSGSAFDLAMLAEGRYGAVMYRVAKVWDLVAPHVLLTEVGCLSTALDGSPVDFSAACRDHNRRLTWCAAPPTAHAAIQAIVARHPDASR